MTMHGNKKTYGFVNCAYYNLHVDGAKRVFSTREARNAAIAELRERAIAHGLSRSAAQAGIYPVIGYVRDLTPSQREDLEIFDCVDVRS